MTAAGRERRAAAIDWAALHARLEAARVQLERSLEPDAETRLRVLEERARELARPEADAEPADMVDLVEFTLSGERYAVDTAFVRETHALRELTPLPGTPAHVLGIVNLRGEIVAVVDLRKLFDLPMRGIGDTDRIVVLHSQAMEFGLLADRIVGTRRLPRAKLQSSLPTLTGIRERYLAGVSAEGLVVLDAARLLADVPVASAVK